MRQAAETRVSGCGKVKIPKKIMIKSLNTIVLQYLLDIPKMSNSSSGILNQVKLFLAQVMTTQLEYGLLIQLVMIGLKNIRFKVIISQLSGALILILVVTLL